MFLAPWLATAATVCLAPPAVSDDSLAAVYASGQTWEAFYSAVDRRQALWHATWSSAEVPEDLLARARAAGTWRLLVITEPGCSDSANSLPYLARLVALAPNLEARFVRSADGRPWMNRYQTPDGRGATPTILLLDAAFEVHAAWVEQPAALQAIWLPVMAANRQAEEIDTKMDWYAQNAGRELLREWVEMLERATGVADER